MAEDAVNRTAPTKNARKRPQKLYHKKDSWMDSPILVSPNFEGAGNGARLGGKSKVHPLTSSPKKERSTAARTPSANESLQLSSICKQNTGPAADHAAANVSSGDKERKKRRRKIAIIVVVLLTALMSFVVVMLYWKLRVPSNHERQNDETKAAPTSHHLSQHSSVEQGTELEGGRTQDQQATSHHTEDTATAALASLHSTSAYGRSVAKLSVESLKYKNISWKSSKTSAELVISRKTQESLSSSRNFRRSESQSYLVETVIATTTELELKKTPTKTFGHIESVGEIRITASVLMNSLSSCADMNTSPPQTEAAKSSGDNDESRNLVSTAGVISASIKMYPGGNASAVISTPAPRGPQPTHSAAETGSPFTRDMSQPKSTSLDDKNTSSQTSSSSEQLLVKSSSKTRTVQFSHLSSPMEMTESSKASTTRDDVKRTSSVEQKSTSGDLRASPGGISGLFSLAETSRVVISVEKSIEITPSPHSTSLVQVTSAVVLPKCRKGAVDETLSHPADCSKYIRCDGNRRYVMPCGVGTLFDPKTKSCKQKDEVTCGKRKER